MNFVVCKIVITLSWLAFNNRVDAGRYCQPPANYMKYELPDTRKENITETYVVFHSPSHPSLPGGYSLLIIIIIVLALA
jgi:hypothetical protein